MRTLSISHANKREKRRIEEKIARARSNIHLASVEQLKTVRSIVGASIHGFLTFKSRARRRRKKWTSKKKKTEKKPRAGRAIKCIFCHSFRYLPK